MDDAEFWQLIERAREESGGNCEAQAALLTQWLSRCTPEKIVTYDGIFGALLALSYDRRLWAAYTAVHC